MTLNKPRRWPLLIPLVAAMAGLLLSRTDVFSLSMAVVIFIILIIVLYLMQQRLSVVVLIVGALWGFADLLHDASRVAVDGAWLHHDMTVTAEVERVEQLSLNRRYVLKYIQNDQGVSLRGKALLYHYRYGRLGNDVLLVAGQHIRVRVQWRLPRNYQNPGRFDYRAWCFDRHIALIGSVRGQLKVEQAAVPWLEQQRQKVRRAIKAAAYGEDGVLPAVLLAERGLLSAYASRFFSATGTAHLLAISGMHVGMAAAWVFALIWFVLTRREAWIVALPVRNIAMVGGFLAAAAYATLAAWPLPAVRAAIMLGAAALAWCLSSRSEPINTLLAALALILLFDPSAIASLSLWLSFVATASLLLWAGKLQSEEALSWWMRLRNSGQSLLWVSVLATLATLPLIIATFGHIPVYSLPANMMMVPLYAVVVMPAAFLGELCALIGLDAWAVMLMTLANWAVTQGLQVLEVLVSLPAGDVWAVQPSLASGLLYGLGMMWAGWLLWYKKHLQSFVVATLVMLAYLGAVLVEKDVNQPLWVVWDVGQGAASTLLLPNKQVIVVDVPGRSGSRFNGGTTVAAGLRALGLSHVDILVLTHAQSDHLGGALSLLRLVNSVGQIWLPDVPDAHADKRVQSIVEYAGSHHITVRWMAKGDGWRDKIDDVANHAAVSISVLWPPRRFDAANSNNTSLVLRIDLSTGVSLLWAGDIEAMAERRLLKAGLTHVDVMLVPHHGSRSSSHEGFVQALKPSVAVVQAGVANRYGFPYEAVVQRYQDGGARVYNTANGAVILDLGSEKAATNMPLPRGDVVERRDQAREWWRKIWSLG